MNMKRMRGRNNRSGGIRHHNGNIPLNRNHVFESNGPDVRVRGTAQQLFEKYLQIGRDATSAGDRVTAEGYFQHAEHYFRILNAINQAQAQSHGGPYTSQSGSPRRAEDDSEEAEEINGSGDQPPIEPRDIPIVATETAAE